jgi:hypothetical protein
VLEREIFAFFFLKEGRSNTAFSSGRGPPLPPLRPPPLPPGAAVSGSLAAAGGRPGNSRPGWVDLNTFQMITRYFSYPYSNFMNIF